MASIERLSQEGIMVNGKRYAVSVAQPQDRIAPSGGSHYPGRQSDRAGQASRRTYSDKPESVRFDQRNRKFGSAGGSPPH